MENNNPFDLVDLLSRTVTEMEGIDDSVLDVAQKADLAAMRLDASLRLFRLRRLREWQTDPFFYLAPGYRGILFLNAMLGRIPRAEMALLQRMRCVPRSHRPHCPRQHC